MTIKMVIPAEALRVCRPFQAVKDVRWYLNGLHITPYWVESSDGHTLARYTCDVQGAPDSFILCGVGVVPMKAETAHLDGDVLTYKDKADNVVGVCAVREADSPYRYPDIGRHLNGFKPVASEAVALNSEYLARLAVVTKKLKFGGVVLNMVGPGYPVKFTVPEIPQFVCMISPMRV